MCGFVGIRGAARRDLPAETPQRLRAASDALERRGPDGSGYFEQQGLHLAHRRLSIIDLSTAASQPMIDAAGHHAIVFNGEIYNYRELFERHCPQDGSVNGNSDTAVLLWLLARMGVDCLPLLDGMFAFAFADLRAHTLLLARDRFGEKPLYHVEHDGAFAFASELKALRSLLPQRSWTCDPEAEVIYASIGSIPAPYTIYRGVQALPQAAWMRVAADGSIARGSYWSLQDAPGSAPRDREEALAQTRERLLDAVSSRLVADVPVGVFLSGGFDSGAIVGLCEALGRTVSHALCIDFEEQQYAEYPLARRSADRFGARLERVVVRAEDFLDDIDRFFAAMDQPTCDGYNTWFVSKVAGRTDIKVWLSGVGGDELFGGYPSFRRLAGLARAALWAQRLGVSGLASGGPGWSRYRPRLMRMLQLGEAGPPALRAYQTIRSIFPWRVASQLVETGSPRGDGYFRALIDGVYPAVRPAEDDFQHGSLYESRVYMGSQLLRDMDNFSMAHSIELRAPFLDHRLFESVYSLDRACKRIDGRTKPLLADALPKPLPEQVLAQPKRGFTFPIDRWLRGPLRERFESAVFEGGAREGALEPVLTRKVWQGFLDERVPPTSIWALFALSRWRQLNCD
jgi:asparagine synthase (glutamine-hydrolysing)